MAPCPLPTRSVAFQRASCSDVTRDFDRQRAMLAACFDFSLSSDTLSRISHNIATIRPSPGKSPFLAERAPAKQSTRSVRWPDCSVSCAAFPLPHATPRAPQKTASSRTNAVKSALPPVNDQRYDGIERAESETRLDTRPRRAPERRNNLIAASLLIAKALNSGYEGTIWPRGTSLRAAAD